MIARLRRWPPSIHRVLAVMVWAGGSTPDSVGGDSPYAAQLTPVLFGADEIMTDFPRLSFQPGNYAAEWVLGERTIAGEFSGDPLRRPTMSMFGDVEEVDWSQGGGFPQHYQYDRVIGHLRSGEDVVLTDADIAIWFPDQRSSGSARHAIVGWNVADVPDDRYSRVRFQFTNADLFFGVAPIGRIWWPAVGTPALAGEFKIEGNPDANHRWEDERADLIAECTYDVSFSPTNAHRHEVTFAPVVSLASGSPLTVDEWVDRWVQPMLGVASLASRAPQRLSWLTVSTEPADASGKERQAYPSGVVFGSGIEQVPYEAEYREEWRRAEGRPLFTLATMPMSLPELLRRWLALNQADNPFIELYGQTLRQTELPARARFLYLIQALEALHSSEQRAADEEAQAHFADKRAKALEALQSVGLESSVVTFIRHNWSKRRQDSLDRRLRSLIESLPARVRECLVTDEMDNVRSHLIEDGAARLEGQLGLLRNQLSHGTRNYDDRVLGPWAVTAETICRAHALRTLGFDDESVESGLAAPSTL